jgi:hypothetical protein
MRKSIRFLILYCKYCHINTTHECSPEVQTSGHGLLWKCERCLRSVERPAAEASRGHQSV